MEKQRKIAYPPPAVSCLSLHISFIWILEIFGHIFSRSREMLDGLVDFLLLVDAELTGTHIDEEQETTTVYCQL